MVILCHGGKFALQYYEDQKLIKTCTDSRYVSRGKQGGRQLNKDKVAKVMGSMGSQMRRENSKILQDNIENFLVENQQHMEYSYLIFFKLLI